MPIANPYRGEVSIDLAGSPRVLRYTWAAVMELRAEYGADFDARISEAIMAMDLDALSKILAIGLRTTYAECTARTVVDASPPISAAVNAVQSALRLAFHGPEGAPATPASHPTKAAPSRLQSIRSWLALKLRLHPVSPSTAFGA